MTEKELDLVLDGKEYEKAKEGDLEILLNDFLISYAEIHNVFAIILDGRLIKNRPAVNSRPPILFCTHTEKGKAVLRKNYTLLNNNGREFIIPDDEALADKDLWAEFFSATGINQ